MSCCGSKISLKTGSCFVKNTEPDEDTPQKCTDPCNNPTPPTVNCPNGGRPRFENWDYVSGNTFYSPQCQKNANIVICSGYLDKFPVGSRITLYDSGNAIGSYKVIAHKPPDTLVIRNTGNAPNGVTFHSAGNFRILLGNHDGHWNDAECKNRPLADNGNIVLTRPIIGVEDACGCEEEAACKCEAELAPGEGFLESVATPEGFRYRFTKKSEIISSLCQYQDLGKASESDKYVVCRNGSPGLVSNPSNIIAALHAQGSGASQNVIAQKNLTQLNISNTNHDATFNVGGFSTSQVVMSAVGGWAHDNNPPNPIVFTSLAVTNPSGIVYFNFPTTVVSGGQHTPTNWSLHIILFRI